MDSFTLLDTLRLNLFKIFERQFSNNYFWIFGPKAIEKTISSMFDLIREQYTSVKNHNTGETHLIDGLMQEYQSFLAIDFYTMYSYEMLPVNQKITTDKVKHNYQELCSNISYFDMLRESVFENLGYFQTCFNSSMSFLDLPLPHRKLAVKSLKDNIKNYACQSIPDYRDDLKMYNTKIELKEYEQLYEAWQCINPSEPLDSVITGMSFYLESLYQIDRENAMENALAMNPYHMGTQFEDTVREYVKKLQK